MMQPGLMDFARPASTTGALLAASNAAVAAAPALAHPMTVSTLEFPGRPGGPPASGPGPAPSLSVTGYELPSFRNCVIAAVVDVAIGAVNNIFLICGNRICIY